MENLRVFPEGVSGHRLWHGGQSIRNIQYYAAQLAQSRDLHKSKRVPGNVHPEEQSSPPPACWVCPGPRRPCSGINQALRGTGQPNEKPLPHMTSESNRGILHYSKNDPNLSQITDHIKSLKQCSHVRRVYCEDNVSAHLVSSSLSRRISFKLGTCF